MTSGKAAMDPTLVERWLEDQREWQRTALTYLDSLAKNDDFLVHLGNAMRGSLLAGKAYPTPAAAAPPPPEGAVDNRIDEVLFALHQIQGQLNDLRLTLDEMRSGSAPASATAVSTVAKRRKAPRVKTAATAKPRKRRTRG